MDNRLLIEEIHGGDDALLEFLFRGDADVAQNRAGELGEKALDEVKPGAMGGREGEGEAMRGLERDKGSGLLGEVRRMIVEDQLDRGVGRIGGIDKLEEFDEFATAMAVPDQSVNLAADKVDAGQQLTVPWRLYSNSRATLACAPGSGGRSGAVVAIAWMPGFSS